MSLELKSFYLDAELAKGHELKSFGRRGGLSFMSGVASWSWLLLLLGQLEARSFFAPQELAAQQRMVPGGGQGCGWGGPT